MSDPTPEDSILFSPAAPVRDSRENAPLQLPSPFTNFTSFTNLTSLPTPFRSLPTPFVSLPTPSTSLPIPSTSPPIPFTPVAALIPETENDLQVRVPQARSDHFPWISLIFCVASVATIIGMIITFTIIFVKAAHQGITTGGDGSTVTMENGTKFTYRNPFGGFWVWDPEDPYNDHAQSNSWTPPLNTTWKWGVDKLYGVNIGGWFVLDPLISPELFQRYAGAGGVDEWTLSTLMAADTINGGLDQLNRHYDTFMTEQDFAEIAGAGLNWIRLAIPWWAIDVWEGEPFLPRTCWKYILRAFQWARKYGIRVSINLMSAPGSQNAYSTSGKQDAFNFLNGTMGYANAQRTLNYIRIFTEFISQPEYVNLIPMFGVIDDPVGRTIGRETLASFYLEVHRMIREITGFGEGKGPYIAIDEGFGNITSWAGVFPNVDRVVIDTHPYFAFGSFGNVTDPSPINISAPDGQMGGIWPGRACSTWQDMMNSIQTGFGVGIAGEYSNGINDCGVNLMYAGHIPVESDCAFWNNWQSWDQATKDGLLNFALASMDALVNPFFWTWKLGDTQAGKVEAPLWSYKLGLDNGWMPKDPRASKGKCAALGVAGSRFNGEYLPWQTGGEGAGDVPPSVTASYPWPPNSIANAGAPSTMPQYTPTGPIPTLPPQTFTAANPTGVDGWYDAGDTVPAPTPIPGCSYPNAWAAPLVPLPIPGCSPGA